MASKSKTTVLSIIRECFALFSNFENIYLQYRQTNKDDYRLFLVAWQYCTTWLCWFSHPNPRCPTATYSCLASTSFCTNHVAFDWNPCTTEFLLLATVQKIKNRRTHWANVVCKVVNREKKLKAVSNPVWVCWKAVI